MTPAPDDSPLSGARRAKDWLEIPLGLVGVLTTLFAAIREKPWILLLGVIVTAASVAWYLIRRAIVRRRRPRITPESLDRGGGAYLRGLLPFERGEKLLGRGRDANTLLTKLRSQECRFAYVSGDAGVGKTSLLRSAVLTELQSSGYVVVYAPKAGSNPVAAARDALRAEVPEARIASDATLLSALRAADAARGKPLVIVWDQFEEFFIAHRTVRDRRPFLEEIGHAYQEADLPIRFVISLRREFVDDLRDLAEWIPQPLDEQFSYRVRNWDAPEAEAVLKAAATHDEVPFADALLDAIVSDLEQAGEVRPVELQLVASRLAELRIYDVDAYNNVERARGVLESYVNGIIKPPNVPADDARERVTRFVLRLLCADTADAKRPVGLTFDEIVERAAASVDDARVPVRELAADCLERATRALLVIREDEERYNLRHDYLARPILDATAGAQTIEQRANRVLDQYLERERSDRRVTIPRRDLRLIRRYASPQRKGEPAATRLLQRSRRRHVLEAVAASVLVLVLATAFFPPRVVTYQTIWDLEEGTWLISEDARTAVLSIKNGRSRVWRIGTPWIHAETVAIPMHGMRVSPRGTWVAGLTDAGRVYVWKVGTPLRPDAQPAFQRAPIPPRPLLPGFEWMFTHGWGDFSPDESLMHVIDENGVYVWHPGETLSASASPVITLPNPESNGSAPIVIYSPRSTFLAVGYRNIISLVPIPNPAQPLEIPWDPYILQTEKIAFSKSGRWVNFLMPPNRLAVVDLTAYPRLELRSVRLPDREVFDALAVAFSPDERQIVFRETRHGFMNWNPSQNVTATPPSLFSTPGSTTGRPDVEFSRDGRWVGGIGPEGAVYIWPSNTTTGAAIKPAIARTSTAVRFSPTGRLAAASTETGEVFVFKPGASPNLLEPAAALPPGYLSLRWSADDRNLFAFRGSDVYVGDATKRLDYVLRAKSPVVEIVTPSDRKTLVVFSKNHLTLVERRLTLWRWIKLSTLEWPRLAPADYR